VTNNTTGLKQENLDFIKESILKELVHKKMIAVSIFGSRAKNTYRQYSDLDLWIESTPPLSISEKSKLAELYEESNLPIKIDIVTPEQCLPVYLDQINSEKKLWFER